MFKRIKRLSICFVCLIALFSSVKILFYTSPLFLSDHPSISIGGASKKRNHPACQIRKGVTKDFWKFDGSGERLHYHIETPYSVLTAYPQGKSYELIEKMHGINCYFQEKISPDHAKQQVRHFQADSGEYAYNKHVFTAESVLISVCQTDGVILQTEIKPEDVFIKGMAKEVSLSLAGKNPDFQAKAFSAHMRSPGSTL